MSTPLEDNLARVQQQIADAAARSGRKASDITLVAVTKYVTSAVAAALIEVGCSNLGESRPQELWRKAEDLQTRDVRWHFIGHLQRNKAKRTLPLVSLIHSCDSLRLLDEMNRLAGQCDTSTDALLEVNISGDESKHGFAPDEIAPAIESLPAYPHVRIQGLMSMASLQGDAEAARADFERLRLLRDEVSKNLPSNVSLNELSMGMSRDFEVAIEEGATLVRVGSALFAGVDA